MPRVILIVMDSLGIGSAADADQFGAEGRTDAGSHTLGHIAEAFARGDCDNNRRSGPLHLPNLTKLGLARASHASSGTWPAGFDREAELDGGFAWAREISSGKDTPSGHWEIAGVPVFFDWSYFPNVPDCFPPTLLAAIEKHSGVSGSLGNCHASGTDIIARLGEEHMRTGVPIYYTSADSVFQIACHEQYFGLQKLHELCIAARGVLDQSDLNIGRVIARPFVGNNATDFERTGNRHDYSVPPPAPTILQNLTETGGTVIGIGKIADIYAHNGISEEIRASGHPALWEETLAAVDRAPDRAIIMTNFVDFDALYGHRRDVSGYGTALEDFDARLPDIRAKLQPGDLLVITADHGNDPTWPGTDHTREHVPVLLASDTIPPGTDFGGRDTFADIAQTIATYLHLPPMPHGVPLF